VEGWRAWIEVDLGALWANYLLLKSRAQEVIPVLKAEAYGHGALPHRPLPGGKGVGRFAVATIAEGRALRKGG
jgi:alanine racemase